MKLIKPRFEILEQESGLNGIYKAIERAGRVSYKSEDKITEDSAKPFVDRMVNSGHGAVLEHGTVYLAVPHINDIEADNAFNTPFDHNPYSRITKYNGVGYVTTNYRTIIENKWEDWLKYLCEPTEYHTKRITVKVICSIGTSREFNRHRANSITEMSTRYCNFSKNKFGNEVTFIQPTWIDIPEGNYDANSVYKLKDNPTAILFLNGLLASEKHYFTLLNSGWKPQQAREVLSLATATEVVYTAFVDDWKHFFDLRCDPHAHPNARELAIPLSDEFIKRGYLK